MRLHILVIALAALAALAGPGMAAITDIPSGGVVFIGEQGLDITAGLGANTQIAWFPSTATAASATPEKIIDVSATKTALSVSPSDFSSYTGNWYSWTNGLTPATAAVAIRVENPSISLRVRDMDAENTDVSDRWLYLGDEAQFQVDSNLYSMSQRPGVAGAPVTIHFQTPDGADLGALTNKAGTSTSLVSIPVATSPFTTGRIWDSGNPRYSAGTYTVWAECTANGMHEIYPQEGATASKRVTVLVQEKNPLITANTVTTEKTAEPSPAATAATRVATTMTTVRTAATAAPPAPAVTTEAATTAETAATGTADGPVPAATTRAPGFSPIAAALACLSLLALQRIRRP